MMQQLQTQPNKHAKFFLTVALVVGVLMIILSPPMSTPDENAHFLNAYSISTGNLFPDQQDGNIGKFIPTYIYDYVVENLARYSGSEFEPFSHTEFVMDSYLANGDGSQMFHASPLYAINPVGYLFSSLGMALGRGITSIFEPHLADLPYNQLLFARMANLAFYIAVIYISLRNTPKFQNTMLLVALMPMSIYLGSSVNYDALIIPTSLLLISELLRLLSRETDRIEKRDIAIILFCTFFLISVKFIYALLLLGLFILPIKKFGTTKFYFQCIGMVVGVALVAGIPFVLLQFIQQGANANSYDVIAAHQSFVFSHLELMPRVFYNTIAKFYPYYFESFIGKLGALDTNFPVPFLVCFAVILLVTALLEACQCGIFSGFQWKRIFLLGGCLLTVAMIFIPMYLTWTPLPGIADGVGTMYISGVQGRYFIPLVLPFLLCISNTCIPETWADRLRSPLFHVAAYTVVIFGILTSFLLLARYWL